MMQKKSPKLGFIICTLALLSVLFFCFPASAETFEVGPELSLSQALDDAVDGDIINVYDHSGLLNSITKNITINIASEKNLSITRPEISIRNATINGRVVVGQSANVIIGEDAEINGNLIITSQATATIDGGTIIATEPDPYAIYVDSATLNVDNGTISTTGQGKTCIYVRNNSEMNINGGTITAIGESATGIYTSDSSLNITEGNIYGQYRAINSSNSAITAVSPAKIKSANMNPVNSTGGNVDIAPGCIYNNPSTKDKVSLKLDITTSDTITFTIDDIGVKDKFYIDIPSSINVRNDLKFYIAEDEDNALATVQIKGLKTIGGSSFGYSEGSFTSITGIIVLNLNISMYYNNTFEEKEIEVTLFQKDIELLEFIPNIVTSEWRDFFLAFSNGYYSLDVYAGSTNAILSLPDSANNMIKAFEILEDGTTVAFENLGENEYKIDLSSVSTQPRINIKVKYADDSTNELLLYINKRAVRVSCSHTQEGIFDVIASYVSHESFTPENPHLLVVYKNGTIFGNEKIIDIKTFDISQYTPNEKGVYEILIEGYQNVYDTSSNTANCADVYLISGDIKPDDEVFSGMVLMDPWRSIWSNFEF